MYRELTANGFWKWIFTDIRYYGGNIKNTTLVRVINEIHVEFEENFVNR